MLARKLNEALPREAVAPSRRSFLKTAAVATAGLAIGLHLPSGRLTSARAAVSGPFAPYLEIAADGTVTVVSAHLDMGQGCWTGCATLAAEELDADWSKVLGAGGSGDTKAFGNIEWGGEIQGTGGSTAMPSSFERYRKAGAMARAMLVEAAARDWGVPAGEITVKAGVVAHPPSGRSTGFGELAAKAADIAPPADVRLKDPSAWTLIGNPKLHRLDNVAKTTGQPIFAIDVRLPGMLTALVVRPPRFGGKVASFDASEALRVKGVTDVVQISRGVAVVADGYWAAKKGRDALKVTWDDGAAETRSSDAIIAEYKALLDADGAIVAAERGDAAGGLAGAARVFKAEFEFPYLAHAALEPLDAVAWRHDDVLEVWGGHQIPDLYQKVSADIAGLPYDKVKLHVTWAGGSFGRRAVGDADFVAETVETAKAIGWRAPVRLIWTREDDMVGGRYRPIYVHRLEAGVDAEGNPVAWRQRIVGQSIVAGGPFSALIKNGVDETSVEGATTLPYSIPSLFVDLQTTEVGVPVLWWRSVGSTHTAYSTEVFIDELAQAAGKDPIAYRLALLAPEHARHRGVLEAVRDLAGWNGTAAEGGRFRGVAVAESFNSFVAQIAEVSMTGGQVKVHKVWCAVDCGTAINPDIIKAQMEGGIGYGLGAILKSEITLADGLVQQTNFDGYQVLTLDEMPEVEVAIVPSTEKPTGVGEPGVPPIGPAVANAVAAATGKRIRVLPFAKNDLGTV